MGKIKTHTFKLGKYHIIFCDGLDGVTDTPTTAKSWQRTKKEMHILDGKDLKALHCALHEAMHANKIADKYIHDKSGYPSTWEIARFLWRLGYRK